VIILCQVSSHFYGEATIEISSFPEGNIRIFHLSIYQTKVLRGPLRKGAWHSLKQILGYWLVVN